MIQGDYRAFLERSRNRRVPLKVSVELTGRCNFRCQHCYQTGFTGQGDVPSSRLLELLEELAGLGTLFLALTGGEPLLRHDWYLIARKARDLGFEVHLLTNGSLIDEETVERLRDLSLIVDMSFHAADPVAFDTVTRSTGSFQIVREAVCRLASAGVTVNLKCPVTRLNAHRLEDVAVFGRQLGVNTVFFAELYPRRDGDPFPQSLQVSGVDLLHFFSSPHFKGSRPTPEISLRSGDQNVCGAGTYVASVTARGDVYGCEMLPVSAGNIMQQSFREIWEGSEVFQHYRALLWKHLEACADCPRSAYCNRCMGQVFLTNQSLTGPSRVACQRAALLEMVDACVTKTGSAGG